MNQLTRMLTFLAERNQDLWKRVDKERAVRPSDWPDYCFLPQPYAYRILNPHPKTRLTMQEMADLVDGPRLAALASWRVTQGIYRFDSDLFDELWETPVNDIPCQIFRRLPEWCVYIELARPPFCGVFVHLNYEPDEQLEQLRLLFHRQGESEIQRTDIVVIALDRPTLEEGFAATSARIRRMLEQEPIEHIVGHTTVSLESYQFSARAASLVLYLCSENADYRRLDLPEEKRTKKGTKFFPPDKAQVIEVGMRIGAALRQARAGLRSETESSGGGGTRPHVRRAHWHHFWTGRKPNQELILKWLSPILVNVDKGAIETTVHPVKS